ncbi:MAG: hypothetical protein HY591_00645, partial [Candidatus Omnitrophica bacterium]|nr:hypothetical protein [Candidatus Omnitrophota bacterium]
MTPEDFIKSYNQLLDDISALNPTRLFWATDFASKNRFSSALPDLLEELAATGKTTQKQKEIRLKRMAGVFYHAFKTLLRMVKARRCLKSIRPGVEYTVVKTFIYNHSFDAQGKYKDVFWGKLPAHLKSSGEVLVYAAILGDYDLCLKKTAAADFAIVPLEAFLTTGDVLRAVWELFATPVRVPERLDFMGHEVSNVVRDCLGRVFKGVQLRQFIQFWSTARLARAVNIKKFYMTYENYPWERMAIMALRK